MRVNKHFFISLVLGSFFASIFWSFIRLPYENPLSIVGYLDNIQENPSNDIVRFIIYLTLPILLYSIYSRISKPTTQNSFELNEKMEISPKKEWVFYFIISMLCGIYIIQENPIFDPFHEGESLGPAIDYLHGKVPYQDFIFCHGLIQDPLRAAWAFELFGQSIGSFRTMSSLLELLALVLLSIFLIRYFKGNVKQATICLLLIILIQKTLDFIYSHGGNEWVSTITFQQGRDSTLYLFLITLTYFNPSDFKSKDWYKQFAVIFSMAFVPVISFIYSIDRGFYLSASSLIIFMLLLFFYFGEAQLKRRMFLFYLLGLLTAFCLLFFILEDGFDDFIVYAFVEMPPYKEFLDGKPYPIFDYRFNFALFFIAFLLLTAFVQLCHLYQNYRNCKATFESFITKYFIELSILICAVLFFRSVLGRSDMFHLRYGIHVSLLLFLIVSVKLYWNSLFWTKQRVNTIGVVALILIGYRIYDKKLFSEIFPISKPDSTYVPKEYVKALKYWNENNIEKSNVYSLSSEASWYYFLNQPCPTRFPVTYFAQREDYQKQLIESLHNKEVKFIHIDHSSYFTSLDSIHIFNRIPLVHNYLVNNYVLDTLIEKQEIWKRK